MKIFVEHIALVAKDPAALKSWYERVLGGKTLFDDGKTPLTCHVSLGNVWFEIYAAEKALPETSDNKLAGFRHIALRVDSVDAAKVEFEQHGVKFTEAERPAAGGGRVLFFKDPEDNLLHFVERPTDSVLAPFQTSL
jgi:glyoxylase I family protein